MHLKSLYLCILMSVSAAANGQTPKRLIYWGWDAPNPTTLGPPNNYFDRMVALPFDGYLIYMQQGEYIFDTRFPAAFQGEADLLATFRDRFIAAGMSNFLRVMATPRSDWDWFSDTQWSDAEYNLNLLGQAVARAGLRGIFFDTEIYYSRPNPWTCRPLGAATSCSQARFDQVAAKVRERGKRFGDVFQQAAPNAIILTTWLLSYLDWYLGPPVQDWRVDPWALLVPFLEGILQSPSPSPGSLLSIVDGHESYYTRNAQEYADDTSNVHNRERLFIDFGLPDPDPLRQAYDRQLTSANAIYLDYLMAISTFTTQSPTSCLSDAGKLLLLKHRVYYALTYADQYAWLYSEMMPLINPDPSQPLTQQAIDKIRYARNLVLLGLPFDEPAPPDLPYFFLGCRTNPQHPEWCQYCPCSCCPPCP